MEQRKEMVANMTTSELHEILDDENRKLTADELKEVVYQLKEDCWGEYYKESDKANANNINLITYSAEANAFQFCLDLLEHLKGDNNG